MPEDKKRARMVLGEDREWDDALLVPSRPRNYLELIWMISVRINAARCTDMMQLVSQTLPLPTHLSHLKRVRKVADQPKTVEVLLEEVNIDNYPVNVCVNEGDRVCLDQVALAQDSLHEEGRLSQDARQVLQQYGDVNQVCLTRVPAYAPSTKDVQKEWTETYWPLHLHRPDRTSLKEDVHLDREEQQQMKEHMRTVWAMATLGTSASSLSRTGCCCGDGNSNRCPSGERGTSGSIGTEKETSGSIGTEKETSGGIGGGRDTNGGNCIDTNNNNSGDTTTTTAPNTSSFMCNACIFVNPQTNHIVGSGLDSSAHHPLRHPIFQAIQEVSDWHIRTWYADDPRLVTTTQQASQLKQLGIGTTAADLDHKTSHEDTPPYLCTGYDCYVLREPCAMCAMALVHSRLRRIVYCIPDKTHGMLGGSGTRLHSLKSLNHHFVVYHMRRREPDNARS